MEKIKNQIQKLSNVYFTLSIIFFIISFISPYSIYLFIQSEHKVPIPDNLKIIFIIIAVLQLILSITFSFCMLLAARYLKQIRKRKFIMIISGILCLFVPIGTLIGINTITLLNDPLRKELFE